jgi:glycerol-3-phosphate cytidylyltransferase
VILRLDELSSWRSSLASDRLLVVTNGCFDILHLGHLDYLEKSKSLGFYLLVGVNGDESVRQLKGPSRPINTEFSRAKLIDGLKPVDAVCIFPEKLASNFLSVARPDIYVKGGDYTPETLDKEEKSVIDSCGAKITIIPFLKGFSTTQTLNKILSTT